MADFSVERSHMPCNALHERFKVSGNGTNYTKQYCDMYCQRTTKMKGVLTKLASKKWGKVPLAERVIDTEGKSQQDSEWAIVGVLYKEMKLRTSVLDDFKGSGTGKGTSSDVSKKISSDEDTLILEDESGRVVIGGDVMKVSHLVSGVLIAVRGAVDADGVLIVSDFITYDSSYKNSSLNIQTSSAAAADDDKYIMLVSGLGMGRARSQEEMIAANDPGDVELARQLLLDWLSGRIGDEQEITKASKVVRLIIAGDSVDVPEIDAEAIAVTYGPTRTKLVKEHQIKSSNIIKRFDAYLAMGLAALPVDVMPGNTDPTVRVMPQQPLHPCLLPVSSRFSSLSLVTNPYDCRLGNGDSSCRIVGHSGQPVQDILRQTDFSDLIEDDAMDTTADSEIKQQKNLMLCLQALKKTFEWGHIAPTAPDTLPCYPLTDSDPFIMPSINSRENNSNNQEDDNNAPHILFAGNQPCFASEIIEKDSYKTVLVCVPVFRETGTVVLVNMRTLEATTVDFQIGGSCDNDMDL